MGKGHLCLQLSYLGVPPMNHMRFWEFHVSNAGLVKQWVPTRRFPCATAQGPAVPAHLALNRMDFVGEMGESFDDWRFWEKQQKCKKRQQLIYRFHQEKLGKVTDTNGEITRKTGDFTIMVTSSTRSMVWKIDYPPLMKYCVHFGIRDKPDFHNLFCPWDV